jgi:hypothetical protein
VERRRDGRVTFAVFDQIGEMRALHVIELQGPGDGVQHFAGDTGGIPALQPGVVLD